MSELQQQFPRILVLGAGGTGGYFGGRLAAGGADVSFLVRPERAAQLAQNGLVIQSTRGDATIAVRTLLASDLPAQVKQQPFDLILLSCKAYDLESSIEAIAPAMTANACVLPILNGLEHYAALDKRFGRKAVLGGLCLISVTKAADGRIVHLNNLAQMTFGVRDASARQAECITALASACKAAAIGFQVTKDIQQELWNKFTLLCALASATCLLRGDIASIMQAESGEELIRALYGECLAVADAFAQPIPPAIQQMALAALTTKEPLKASMLRDLESGAQVEAAHIVGDMFHRARQKGLAAPLLQAAWCHLQVYQRLRGSPANAE